MKKILLFLLTFVMVFSLVLGLTACNKEDADTDKNEEQGDTPGDKPSDEPGNHPGDEPGDQPGNEPGDEPGDEPGNEPGDEPGDQPGDEPGNEPGDEPGDQPGDECTHKYSNGTCVKCGAADPNYTPGGECTHKYVDGVCTECGGKDPHYSPDCNHAFNSVGKDPTCSTTGHKTYTCRLCGYSYTETIPVSDHEYDSDGRCQWCGRTDPNYNPNNKCEHSYVDGYCQWCKEPDPNYNPGCNHSYVDGYCQWCKEPDPNYNPGCNHSYVDGYCQWCKEPDPNYNPGCNHNYVDGYCQWCKEPDPNYNPGCTHSYVDGYCQWCKEPDPNYNPGCNHNYVDGYCQWCKEPDPNYNPGGGCENGHTPGKWIQTGEATCLIDGQRSLYCDICGTLIDIEIIPATGVHSFIDGYCEWCYTLDPDYKPGDGECEHNYLPTESQEPACGVSGYIVYTCVYCKDSYTMVWEALKHSYVDGYCQWCKEPDPNYIPGTEDCHHVWVPATCTEDGHCELCGARSDEDAFGHHYNEEGYCYDCGEFDPGYTTGCKHQWVDGFCPLCESYCDHVFEGPTCIHCGYVSGGIDNPLIIYFEDMEYYVPYSASVYDIIMSYIGLDYDSLYNGSWSFIPEGYNYEIPLNEYTVLTDYIEYGRRFTFVWYKDTECTHNWISATCTENGYCQWCGEISESAMGHDFGISQYCHRCGAENPDYYPEYVQFMLYFLLYEYNGEYGGYTIFEHCDKGWMETGGASEMRNTLGNFLGEYTQLPLSEYDLIWYANGEKIDESYIINPDDVIIAISAKHPTDFSTTLTISFPDGKIEEVYTYPCPVDLYTIFEDFENKYNIDLDIYHLDYYSESIDGLGYGDITASYIESSRYAYVCLIDGYTTKAIYSQNYPATKYPTPREFIIESGLNPDDYIVFNHSSIVSNIDEKLDYMNLYVLEKSKVSSTITVNVTFKEDIYSDTVYSGSFTTDTPFSLARLFEYTIETENGEMHLPNTDYYYAFTLNGSILEDPTYTYIYEDCTLEISPAYNVYLSYYDNQEGNYIDKHLVFTSEPTGEMILSSINFDLTMYTIYADYMMYEYESFIGTRFASNEFTVSLIPNKVNIDITVEDENGYTYNYENSTHDVFATVYIPKFEQEYVWTLYRPDGSSEIVTDDIIYLYFDPANYEYYGNDSKLSNYKLIGVCQTFTITVSTDSMSETISLNKNNNLTIGEILMQNFGIEFDNYVWSCHGDGYYDIYKEFIPTSRLELSGSDVRPRINLYVNGTNYTYYHTEALSLDQIITVFNNEFGLSLDFDSYMWSVNGERLYDPYIEVAMPEYWCDISASVLSSVSVRFYSAAGWVGDHETPYVYSIGDAWITPELDSWHLDMHYGLMTFSGKWEYRSPDGTTVTPVNSVNDLFKLKLNDVELYAVLDVDYSRLCGLYYTDMGYVVEITEKSLSYAYVGYGSYFDTFRDLAYEVNTEYTEPRIITEDGMIFEARYFQDYFKITENDVRIIVCDPYGSSTFFDSIESYNDYVQCYNIDSIVDFDGNKAGEVALGNVYFVYTSEKEITE